MKHYKRQIDAWMTTLSEALSPEPITCVVIWNSPALLRELRNTLESIQSSFGDQVEFVFVSNDSLSLQEIAEDQGGRLIEMTIENLGSGIRDFYGVMSDSDHNRCAVPTRAGAPHSLDQRDRLWLEEELEIVHLDVGTGNEECEDSYRQGAPIQWRNLNLRHDCERESTGRIRRRVEEDLRTRRTTRINIVHAPGAGGTTIAKRVLWDLHKEFPCLVLHDLDPLQTSARLARLSSITGHSLCLLVDGSEHQESDVGELADHLVSQQVSVVMIQVLRQFSLRKNTADRERTFHLSQELEPAELDRFVAEYKAARPERSRPLEQLLQSADTRERTAFYVGLTAYGREFRGLERYVTDRVKSLSLIQRRIVLFLALSYHYGQQSIPEQAFAEVLGIPRSRRISLGRCLDEATLELLVKEGNGEWRVSHALIADELLQQLLAPGQPPRRNVWKQQLSEISMELARFLRGEWQSASGRLGEIAQRVFVFRDSSSLLGTESAATAKYSRLLEDIPTPEGRLELLRTLTAYFPDEAHFHAHLGRFCGLTGRFGEALKSVDKAVLLNGRDPVLHHMKGMVYRYQIRALMADSTDSSIEQIVSLVKLASASFEEARRIDPQNEHAFISEVQLIVFVLDYAARKTKQSVETFVYSPGANPYLRDCLERAEDLLDQLQTHRRGERHSNFEIDCRARLDAMYGDYSKSLQGWNNLLDRPDVSRVSVRRQIVWTILRQKDGAWAEVETKRVRRCVELLEANLAEKLDDNTSIRMWLRAVRHMAHPPSIESVIEKVSHWRVNAGALDASFYLFVLHSLLAMDGSGLAVADAERALEDCKKQAGYRRDRNRSFEWFGVGEGVQRLRHQSELGEWTTEMDFYPRTDLLTRVNGVVRSIDARQKGFIEIGSGQRAFFVPAVAGLEMRRDENVGVSFFLGFSYEGLRAWDVKREE